jgi:hypothetical protein
VNEFIWWNLAASSDVEELKAELTMNNDHLIEVDDNGWHPIHMAP